MSVEYGVHHMQLARVRVQARPAALEGKFQPVYEFAELHRAWELLLKMFEHLRVETVFKVAMSLGHLEFGHDWRRMYNDFEAVARVGLELD